MFVDDKKEVVEAIKRSFPGVYVVHMRRRDAQAPASDIDFSVRDFPQLMSFVKEWRAAGSQ